MKSIMFLSIPAFIVLLAHITFRLSSVSIYQPDSHTYINPTFGILSGIGLVTDSGAIETSRTPGYPIFLALCYAVGLSDLSISMLQHILYVFCGLLAAVWLFKTSDSRMISSAFFCLFCLDPAPLANLNFILSDWIGGIFVLFFLIIAFGDSGGTHSLASGLVAGIAVVIRPINLPVALVGSVNSFFARNRGRFLSLIFFLIGVGTTLGPWLYRQHHVLDRWTVSTLGDWQMTAYKIGGITAMSSNDIFSKNPFDSTIDLTQSQLEACLRDRSLETCHADIRSELLKKASLLGALKLAVRSVAYVALGVGDDEIEVVTGLDKQKTRIISALGLAIAWLLATVGVFSSYAPRRLRILASVLVVALMGISIGAEAYGRFRIAMIGPFAILFGVGVNATYQSIRKFRH